MSNNCPKCNSVTILGVFGKSAKQNIRWCPECKNLVLDPNVSVFRVEQFGVVE